MTEVDKKVPPGKLQENILLIIRFALLEDPKSHWSFLNIK